MKDIAIYGAGGAGREIYCFLTKINEKEKQWNIVGFFDDGLAKGSRNEYGEILGGIDELNSWETPIGIILAFGDGRIVEKVSKMIQNTNVDFPNILYLVTFVDENNFQMGKGNIILGGCFFSCKTSLGDFNYLNGYANIGHDVHIGSYNTFMPRVLISGDVIIGNTNFFGSCSLVLQQLKIGNGVRLGAGSVMMTKPKNDSLYLGNPAKLFKY